MPVHPAVIKFLTIMLLVVEHILRRKWRRRKKTGQRTTPTTLIRPSSSGMGKFLLWRMLKENHWVSSSSRILRESWRTPSKSTDARIRLSVKKLTCKPGANPSSPPTTHISLLVLLSVQNEQIMDSLAKIPYQHSKNSIPSWLEYKHNNTSTGNSSRRMRSRWRRGSSRRNKQLQSAAKSRQPKNTNGSRSTSRGWTFFVRRTLEDAGSWGDILVKWFNTSSSAVKNMPRGRCKQRRDDCLQHAKKVSQKSFFYFSEDNVSHSYFFSLCFKKHKK